MRYRADIDGLRAVAVLPVVFYHAGYALFGGGYVGVDIFFVISGFLITHIIAREVREQRFSIVNFYERRIRRIFPALAVVLLFTWAASFVVLLPNRFREFSQSLVAASLFVSNIQFWREAGYFDAAAETKPLLHTWSLSVEEQFYIFFPLILWLLRSRSRPFLIRVLIGAAIASLGLSIFRMETDQSAAFFLSDGRAWELLLGALLALGAFPKPQSRTLSQALAALGLALIGYSVFAYTSVTPFPGWAAVPPCVGSVLIILAGETHPTWVGKLLSLPAMVFVGKISYSLYLWHWPLLIVAKHFRIEALSQVDLLVYVAVSIAAAVLSWRFVERPFRGGAAAIGRKQIFAMAGVVIAAGVGVGAAGHLKNGWPNRFSPQVLRLAGFGNINPEFTDCSVEAPCLLGTDGGPADLFLWGDSHAGAVAPAIDDAARASGRAVTLYTRPGCIPVAGIAREPDITGCEFFAEEVLARLLEEPAGQTVVLAARWARVLEGELDTARLPVELHFTDRTGKPLTREQQRDLLHKQTKKTIGTLTDHGYTVVLIYPIPEHRNSVPETLTKRAMRGMEPADYNLPLDDYRRRQADNLKFFDSLPQTDQLIRVYPDRVLCVDGRCIAYEDGQPLYRDGDHLSLAGAAKLVPLFEEALRPRAN